MTLRRLLFGLFALVCTALLGAAPAVLFGAGTAVAHSVPVASDPANGARVDSGPEQVSVTFNEALQESYAALTVTGPDGNQWSHGDPVVKGATISVGLGELGPVGDYTIAYRVTSADGHPVSGTRTFTLTEAGDGTPTSTTAAQSDESDGGVPIWPFVVVAVVLFVGGLAFVLRKPKNG
ncbi:copper resistance protein CopC [Aldersonia sp. NBC_00410]|uniref:copper resistance CopC family protein n=1 Tax=Aldersonia sp. NBC_00410 TaxID=2975954 RepID=UPI00224C9F19|nr:copper resistance CopC family protein [Aldersonia sp. NBC_00410]MCX5045101.1 copper resistance protein CopC [Aldersonia sp. NBC_00410]